MAYCLNPECPHKMKIGRPAEFREGITHCSDCGSLLSEEIIEEVDTCRITRRITLTDLQKRILYTIGLILLWRILGVVPVPGINFQALGNFFEKSGYEPIFTRYEVISVIALGIFPYLPAYMIIEILSIFTQPLKSWRIEGYSGRVKIRRVALLATFLLALWQGYGMAYGLEGLAGTLGEKIIRSPGLSSRLVLTLTLTAGTFLTIWIAELITRKGIGHGISVLIFTGFAARIFSDIPQIKLVTHEHSLNPLGSFLSFAIVLIALTAFIVLLEKGHKRISVKFKDGVEAYIPLKLTSAGTTPVEWASMLIMLPTTVLLFTKTSHFQWLTEALTPIGFWYSIINSIIIIFLYYLFTSFFYNPSKMTSFLKDRHASIESSAGENEESYIDRSLEGMIPIGALYLCFIVFAPKAIFRFLGFNLEGIDLIIAVTILLDLIGDVRLRKKENNLVKVAELHDVPMAGLVKSLLEQKGLPCYLRGYYHRALLYFFGPYIEISVLVPQDRMTDAKEVIENYLDANILTVRSE
jgi:preprotein translocase subunit SecY